MFYKHLQSICIHAPTLEDAAIRLTLIRALSSHKRDLLMLVQSIFIALISHFTKSKGKVLINQSMQLEVVWKEAILMINAKGYF